MSSFDPNTTLGALQIGVLISYVLFGIMTSQTYIYYRHFTDDPPRLKVLYPIPWPNLVDVGPQLSRLSQFSVDNLAVLAPPSVQKNLLEALEYLDNQRIVPDAQRIVAIESTVNFLDLPDCTHPPIEIKQSHHVAINRQTTVETLYEYPRGYVLEYPETSSTGCVGHLFHMDPNDWQDPILNIAYSRGGNLGQTLSGKVVKCRLLVDKEGNQVDCFERHSTCEGSKICPNSDADGLSIPHTKASRTDVRDRLRKDREERLQFTSPSRDIFLKTLSYIAAIQKLGCSRPLFEATGNFSATEEEMKDARDLYLFQTQRGYRMKEGICEGRVVFDYGDNGRPYISCEHYNPKTNKDHLHDGSIGDGSYHVEYMEAIFCGDEQEALQIEEAAFNLGYGPLTTCTTIANFSQQKAYCPFPHRDNNNNLVQPLMEHLECSSKFRVFQPKQEFRAACPFVLIVTHGAHPHPVPLPTKTPPKIRTQVLELLGKLAEDLPDITPRRFIRHPIVQSFLVTKFPTIISPTLADWHVSLSNRSHLRAFIKHALESTCPFGTGWAGVINLKARQDKNLPKDKHYIRRMITIDARTAPRHEEDDESTADPKDNMIRIIICMAPEASCRLRSMGRYLQSDIAFTRIASFLEFELACMDRDANTSLIFCRVYVNRQSAVAHQRVFDEIEAIVKEDTGEGLKWRHIHGALDGVYNGMVLSWTADQHRGQAKGLGLHLQKVASQLPLKQDLHEPARNIQDLTPYEHLRRLFRICVVHDFRNIKKCAVSDEVRWLMRSLVCIEHDDWDGTLAAIREKGGKVGNDWVNDKQSSKFFFPGICWERSFIPLDIWSAGDANSKISSSGLQKAQRFDALKIKTLITYEEYGITPSYKTGHISENMYNNLKRKANSQHRVLRKKIERYNDKLLKSLDTLDKAEKAVATKETQLSEETRPEKRQKMEGELEKKRRAEERARRAFEKQHAERSTLKRGSGKVLMMDCSINE
ncbi:hypothetical protein C8F04DRAFT_1403338 [Mycena alexandri]|uniref:Uncharacterized protein n=1 Tax=Mycena alexandri TaxID=1745969 RepID=A0AAD6S4U8_9AGAR|nr:hypothetical protein C8F04DRAFT_1403338 [Mycena alexandri]